MTTHRMVTMRLRTINWLSQYPLLCFGRLLRHQLSQSFPSFKFHFMPFTTILHTPGHQPTQPKDATTSAAAPHPLSSVAAPSTTKPPLFFVDRTISPPKGNLLSKSSLLISRLPFFFKPWFPTQTLTAPLPLNPTLDVVQSPSSSNEAIETRVNSPYCPPAESNYRFLQKTPGKREISIVDPQRERLQKTV
ncbi:hypothetical protein COLO4_06178 [Corchorus olitorius]|uniref:Uncharacterized protein n=1 Tax=Corchorus olitorius TaxID=93759 RepID=A0A1R3KNY7_9ROSI|nr:hypothetical protein COLO4_06178 [Corchorus olitorius]